MEDIYKNAEEGITFQAYHCEEGLGLTLIDNGSELLSWRWELTEDGDLIPVLVDQQEITYILQGLHPMITKCRLNDTEYIRLSSGWCTVDHSKGTWSHFCD